MESYNLEQGPRNSVGAALGACEASETTKDSLKVALSRMSDLNGRLERFAERAIGAGVNCKEQDQAVAGSIPEMVAMLHDEVSRADGWLNELERLA